jgi:pyruvate dehydrogenase E1 component alpha subunit
MPYFNSKPLFMRGNKTITSESENQNGMATQDTATVDSDIQRNMLETMVRIRQFETRVKELFADNEMPGFVHLYIGEEAIAAGVCEALEEDDKITSTHRGHGHCIGMGLDLDKMMAELYAKKTGYNDGKGGSMHIADVDQGMLGANGIVGAGGPIATGAALSSKMRDSEEVAVSFMGDGALSQGAFHESFNLASLWDLPLIGVIENNKYGEMTGVEDHHPEGVRDDLSAKGEAYAIEHTKIDGMDPETVYTTAKKAIERARNGGGPTLIECEAYRFRGHHEGDTEFYRNEEEVQRWRERDPLDNYPEKLLNESVITEEELDELRADVNAELEEAVEFARESPLPEPEEAYEGLYAEEI